MSARKGTSSEADWAADSARSDDLAASGPRVDLPMLEAQLRRSQPPPASEPMAPIVDRGPPGERPRGSRSLGKYHFIATLGRGGMADVHLAVSVGPAGFSKLQVIKCLRSSIAEEPELKDMLLDEARLAARLNHRNVVQTNEVGLADGEYFLAMEYLDGQPLSRIIARARERERPIPLAVSLWILSEVLAGLHYAHDLVDYDGSPLHVVHRDVSPHNIFVTYDGQVKVVDFGIALAAQRAVETQAGTLKGKVAYMAPEQAFSPSSEIDRRVDIFSVGVIFWEMIAGRRLWRGLTDPQIISRLLRDIPDVRTARHETPFELARICGQALARVPEDRYATAAELRAELERYAEGMGEQVTAAQVGELVSGLFGDARADIRAVIDRQLRALGERPDDGEGAWDYVGRRSTLPALAPPESPYDDAATAVSRAAPTSMPSQGTLHAIVRPEEPRPRSRRPLIAAVAAAAVLAGAALVLALRGPAPSMKGTVQDDGASAAAPPAPPPAATVEAAVAAPAGSYIAARISVNPLEAKILVDDSELPTNPFEGKLIKDGAAHRIEMSAPGFNSQRRMVVFDKDIELDVKLFPAAKGGTAPPPRDRGSTGIHDSTGQAGPGDVTMPPPKPDPY